MATVQYAAREAGDSKTVGWAGRLGLVAMGVSYGLVAVLAIMLATDGVLFVVAAGLLAFGVFCLFQARYRRV